MASSTKEKDVALVKAPEVNNEGITVDEQVTYSQMVLKTLAIDDQTRLRNGLKLRDEMHATLAKGQNPSGYRIEWINECMGLILETLRLCAEKFNAIHPEDKVSVLDFCDILMATHNTVKSKA